MGGFFGLGAGFGFIGILVGVVQIILFIKIWIMTNDVREIKEKYLSSDNRKQVIPTTNVSSRFNVNDLVVEIATGKQMRIKAITVDGKYSCFTGGGTVHVGNFDASEIKLLDV